MTDLVLPTLNEAWHQQLSDIFHHGHEVAPRAQPTKELPQRTLVFDMNHPVITYPARQMGYRFMAAEAWWILSGRDDVAAIAPYSKMISQFSDDGERFFGAYGPKVVGQLDYVVDKLIQDPDTRQAGMTLWRENPGPSKDIPCTIALWFQLRRQELNLHVFMRSSDNWLGVPYDAFNFTMIACEVVRQLNLYRRQQHASGHDITLGLQYLTAASAHLYERDFAKVERVFGEAAPPTKPVPPYLYGVYLDRPDMYYSTVRFLEILKDCESDHAKYRWWCQP